MARQRGDTQHHTSDDRPRARATGDAGSQCTGCQFERQQNQWQPCLNFQDGKLQRRIAGEIAAESEDHRGHQPTGAAAGQPARQQVGKQRHQRIVQQRLQLQPMIQQALTAGGYQHRQQTDRIEDGRLRISQEGMARKSVGVPKG